MKTRILLISDMHYTTQETFEELRREFPDANTSAAAGTILGFTQKEKIQRILSDILSENAICPLDAVLVLGDLSIDDYDYRKLPECYCKKFKGDVMDKLPCPAFAIPGNHDSIPEERWRNIFGYGREYSVKIGNNVFLMLDTFKNIPAKGACGGTYSGIDRNFVESELSKYKDGENIFICTHYVSLQKEEKALEIPNLKCIFMGHTHCFRRLEFFGTPLYDIGGYGYNGVVGEDGKYTFNRFFPECAWGYEVLEIEDNTVSVMHKRIGTTYYAENGVFEVKEKTYLYN